MTRKEKRKGAGARQSLSVNNISRKALSIQRKKEATVSVTSLHSIIAWLK